VDSKDGGVSHTRAESTVLATSGHRGIGVSRYRDIRILRYQDIGITGYRGFGVGRLAGLAELAGLSRLAGLARLAELASWESWESWESWRLELEVRVHQPRHTFQLLSRSYRQQRLSCQSGVMLPGGRSWCQAGGHGASQAGRGSGITIGKDDGVAMVISLFYPGRVHDVGYGISVEAGYRR